MNARVILVGTKLELELFDKQGVKKGRTFTGELLVVISDMDVLVYVAGKAPNDVVRIKALFTHPLQGIIRFAGTITRIIQLKDGTKYYIKIDEDFKMVCEREYFRPDCYLRAEYCLKDNIDKSYKPTKTRNISFKGGCILLDEDDGIKEGDLLDLNVWIRDDLSIKMQCKVIRVIEFIIDEKKSYEIGLVIEAIGEQEKAVLTEYITQSAIIKTLKSQN